MKEMIQAFIENAEKNLDFAGSAHINYEDPAQSLPQLANYMNENGFDGSLGETLVALLELNYDPENEDAQDYDADDISDLYDYLRIMYPYDADIWRDSARFEYMYQGNYEKAVVIIRDTLEMQAKKTEELNSLLADISKDVDDILEADGEEL